MRNHLKDNWDIVGLIDDTVFAVREDQPILISWPRGNVSDHELLIHDDVGTLDDFAVINDKLFFVEYGQVEYLYSIDLDTGDLSFWSTSSYTRLVDAYLDLIT